MRTLMRFWHLPAAEKGAALEAWARLVSAWVLVTLIPYSWWSHRLGECAPSAGNATPLGPQANETVKQVNRTMSRAARCLPFAPSCLVWCMGHRSMLTRRHISSILHIGVPPRSKRDPLGQPELHAWLQVGDVVVTGQDLAAGFNSVVEFGN